MTPHLLISSPKRAQWANHKSRWLNCSRCALSQERHSVVLLQGHIPCDYLFIGEGPDHSDDASGFPFAGPEGDILQAVIQKLPYEVRCAYTYLVGCISFVPESNTRRPPLDKEITACRPRILELLSLLRPVKIIALGTAATRRMNLVLAKRVKQGLPPIPLLKTLDPKSILYAEGEQQQLLLKQFTLSLSNFLVPF